MKAFDVADGVVLAGIAAIVFGAWQVYRPAAWVLGGVLVIVWAVLVKASKSSESERPE